MPCRANNLSREPVEPSHGQIASKFLAARSNFVIPAKAGIQTAHPLNHCPLDSRLRGNDDGIRCDRPDRTAYALCLW